MRILILSRDAPGLGPTSGLAGRWRLLRDQGIELEVILASKRQGVIWEEPGLRVQASGGAFALARFWKLYQLGVRAVSGVQFITSEDPLEIGLVAALIAQAGKKPFELQDHAGCYEGLNTYEPFWRLRQPLAQLLRRFTRVIRTVNPQSLKRLQEVYHAPAYWLPIAPHERFGQIVRQPTNNTMLCVARFVPVKRLELLLESFALFQKRTPEARLVVVGDGPLKTSLVRLAVRLGIAEAVDFPGTQDPLPFLERARAFVLLSAHEGWGVAAVEAATAGVPVLMTSTGCGPWLAEQGRALLVTQDQPLAIAEKMTAVWNMSIEPLTEVLSPAETAVQQVAAWRRWSQSSL